MTRSLIARWAVMPWIRRPAAARATTGHAAARLVCHDFLPRGFRRSEHLQDGDTPSIQASDVVSNGSTTQVVRRTRLAFTAIRALRMQKDQLQVGHTSRPSDSEPRASATSLLP